MLIKTVFVVKCKESLFMQEMKNIVLNFMKEQAFPEEAVQSLTVALDKIYDGEGLSVIKQLQQEYQEDYRIKADVVTETAKKISEISGVDQKQCNIIIYMGLVPTLKKHYINKGYPLEIFYDTIRELKCKLLECYDCFGVWGMRGCHVSNTHFAMTRFGMGVFQFELMRLEKDFLVNGVQLKKGDLAVNIHIPRLGEPITYEARHSAYKRAKEFFKPSFPNDDKIPFYCHSWILFKKHREILKPTSNMVSFMDDFDTLVEYDYPDYNETWRIFGRPFTTIEEMPKDSSVQKAYAKIIECGEKTGGSEGVFLY